MQNGFSSFGFFKRHFFASSIFICAALALSACEKSPESLLRPTSPKADLGRGAAVESAASADLPADLAPELQPAPMDAAPEPASEMAASGEHPIFTPPQIAPSQAASAAIAALPIAAGRAHILSWDEMVPASWDPMAGLGDIASVAALPDSDVRVQQLYARMRAAWDRAPTVAALNGRKVELAGFVVPLEADAQGRLRELLLVPYFGACIHTPAPPANQIVHVRLDEPAADIATMDAVTVTGALAAHAAASGEVVSGYMLRGVGIEKITPVQ